MSVKAIVFHFLSHVFGLLHVYVYVYMHTHMYMCVHCRILTFLIVYDIWLTAEKLYKLCIRAFLPPSYLSEFPCSFII